MKKILLLFFVWFSLLKAKTIQKDPYIYIGIDSSIFEATVSTFNGVATIAGISKGPSISSEKTTIFEYSTNSSIGSTKNVYSVYVPHILATESVDLVKNTNSHVKIKETQGRGLRTINITGLYTDIPDIFFYIKYLEKEIKNKKKEDEKLKCLGVTIRGYFTPSVVNMIECALKAISSLTTRIQILTDGMAQAIDIISSINGNEEGYITTYSFRGDRLVAEIFKYEKKPKGGRVTMIYQKNHAVYSEYKIISIVYNHLINEIKKLGQNRHPNMQIRLEGLPNMCLSDTSHESTQKDSSELAPSEEESALNSFKDAQSENNVKSIQKPLVECTIDILPLLNKALAGISKLEFTRAERGSAEADSNSVKKKEAKEESIHKIYIKNQKEISTIDTLLIELVNKTTPGKLNNLCIFVENNDVKILLDMTLAHYEILQYIENAREGISKAIAETEESLKKLTQNFLKVDENMNKEPKEKLEAQVIQRSAVYSDIISGEQLETILYGLGFDKMLKPSKAVLSVALINMMKYNIFVLDSRNTENRYMGRYELNSIMEKKQYCMNNQKNDWTYFNKNIQEEVEIKDTLWSLISKDKNSKEYKTLHKNFKNGLKLLDQLEKEVDKLVGDMLPEEFIKTENYQKVALMYVQAQKDFVAEKKQTQEISKILEKIKNATKEGFEKCKKYKKEAPESCEAFKQFAIANIKEKKIPIVSAEYTENSSLQEIIKYRREIQRVLDEIEYKSYLILDEYNEYMQKLREIKKQAEAEKKKAAAEEKEAETPPKANKELNIEKVDEKEAEASPKANKELEAEKADEKDRSVIEAEVIPQIENDKNPEKDLNETFDEDIILKKTVL